MLLETSEWLCNESTPFSNLQKELILSVVMLVSSLLKMQWDAQPTHIVTISSFCRCCQFWQQLPHRLLVNIVPTKYSKVFFHAPEKHETKQQHVLQNYSSLALHFAQLCWPLIIFNKHLWWKSWHHDYTNVIQCGATTSASHCTGACI